MATGDLNGNLERLLAQMRSIGYPKAIDVEGLKLGLPSAMLPLLHHALLGYSRHVSKHLSSSGYQLHAKSDLRFVENVLKVIQTEFSYRSPLTVGQLFSKGFAERKMLLVHDVVQCCKRMHNELLKLARQLAPSTKTAVGLEQTEEDSRGFSFKTRRRYEVFVDKKHRRRNMISPNIQVETSTADHVQHIGKIDVFPKSPGERKERRFVEILMRSPSPVANADYQRGPFGVSSPKKVEEDCLQPQLNTPEKTEVGSAEPRSLSDSPSFPSSPKKIEPKPDASLPRMLDVEESRPPSRPRNLSPNKPETPKKVDQSTAKDSPRSDRSSKMLDAITGLLHDEIKQKIHEISEKIEPRFGSFERALTKTSKQIEAQLSGLECRIKLLEDVFRANVYRDVENKSPGKLTSSPPRYDVTRIPSPTHVARDISNVHYVSSCPPREADPVQQRRELSTPELIAAVKARCHKTNELLNRRLI